MIYNNCPLYNLKSKKVLKFLLGIKSNQLLRQSYISLLIEPYIDSNEGKLRLIEPPHVELKIIQTRIKNMLGRIIVPDNIFSGIKGRSYADNAAIHTGDKSRHLFKIDLTAFFPSIRRETVYNFFKRDLQCSSDIAKILANFSTIDLCKAKLCDPDSIFSFLNTKHVKNYNHLISGAPTSQILSYLVNHDMFDELQKLSRGNNTTMSVYVDDITFSSEYYISKRFKDSVLQIIKKYGYRISTKKVKSYTKLYPKLVTGVIINSTGGMTLKNSLRKKVIDEYRHLLENPNDYNSRQRLRGLITSARQINKMAFPTIHKFAFSRKEQECAN